MTRLALRIGIVALAALGLWQLGAGAYIHAKAWLAQQLIASAWARTLAGEANVRPWPWADTRPVARLQVPEASVDLYVLADASGRSLAFGPGHVSGTAPLGSSGHSMLAAHRDTHFRFLRSLPVGARLWLETADGRRRPWRLVETHVFDVRHQRLMVPDDMPTLTLLTCYPFDALAPGGPLRYAAIAEPLTSPVSGRLEVSANSGFVGR